MLIKEHLADEPQVLIVDDCGLNRLALQGMVSQLGFTFDTALSGLEAIKLFKQRLKLLRHGAILYRLILMDYSMHSVSGLEATRKIRRLVAKYNTGRVSDAPSPYIVCCTAFGGKEFRDEALRAGMDRYLSLIHISEPTRPY